jgi:Ring finger domain
MAAHVLTCDAHITVNAEGLICPICLEDFKDNDHAIQLGCNGSHHLCYECFLDYYHNSGMRIGDGPGLICPLCRGVSELGFHAIMHEGRFSGMFKWLYCRCVIINDAFIDIEEKDYIVFMKAFVCSTLLLMLFYKKVFLESWLLLFYFEAVRYFVNWFTMEEDEVFDDYEEEVHSIVEITEEVIIENAFENPIEISDDETDDDESIEMIVEGTRADYPIVID